ncbi:MAG: NAD-binding protein [Acidimicrobiales bacterium]
MAQVVMVGGGVVGLGVAMMLARDGNDVEVLERDPQPPPDDLDEAWESWERRGVAQFRLAHAFLARYRQIVEAELPELIAALEAGGALRQNPLLDAPEVFHGGERPGDDRFVQLTGRRVMVERAVATLAAQTPGLSVRRGTAVTGLLTGASTAAAVPHVTGVRTEDGEEHHADLVVDASGRRSALPSWLEQAGARSPTDVKEDSGFIYYGRHYHSPDGTLPVALGAPLQSHGSISTLTLPADNGYWSVVVVARSDDRALLRLKDVGPWEKVARSLPTVAHWIDGEPVEDRIVLMSKIEDRIRHTWLDGKPVATGLAVVADAYACTNPSLGRGASIGSLHGLLLRDCLRERGSDHPLAFAESFATATAEKVEPWYEATLDFDRQRLAEMAAEAEGRPFDDVSPTYDLARSMGSAIFKDPDCFRAFLDVTMVQALPSEVLARPGIHDKVVEFGSSWRDDPPNGPPRDQLVELANS